ncbi:MAG: Eco57I restriction-modification methylase domain-containing protein [Bacteroidota bacterium]
MELKELKPRKALNKAFLKVKPNRTEIEGFKANLITLLDRTNDTESEEFHKNLVSDFLKKTYYDPNHFINTKGRNDLVIHNGQNANSTVGVILEAKKPTNKTEMITTKKLNAKAFQELVLYYLRERITHKNLEVKHLVATNINEWFIFDATLFDRLFAQNKNLVKQFNDFEAGRLADTKTDFFYKQIAEPFIADITAEIEFTYFNIQDYQQPLRNTDKADDYSLIALFKLLSPEHLLKLPFTNDSNSLDKRFYSELLHIIGLKETNEKSKKLIERNKEGERYTGTILENAIIQLDSLDKLSRLENPNKFGNTQQERLFNIALELSITWINRILFLKLLEAQLITYHNSSRGFGKGDKSYSFLNLDKIKNYDDLNSLFFQVLARKYDERNEDVKQLFEKVPYLNSSLFEPTDIEQITLFISNLKDDKTIPIFSQTVLKDQQGKKRSGNISTLEYLFEFLDAYDFGAEGGSAIQEDNKTLINASVLGLIFEKINGYKDGSFFTPGFITMYMCRETIRKAVVQKFNETKKWNCNNIEELYDKIEDRKEANKIVNSIKICDPAVGSGHFLVSALNEMIAVKNDLKILQDRDGKRLKEYQVEVVNDELIVTDEEGELFEYNPSNKESQRIQETLFHEKQTIIENCLFGVDINTNSVKICRLRLWIELLKSAYYKQAGSSSAAYRELETLPNIDINIKCGNSLVSRFSIDADLKQALKKSKWTIESYRVAVATYRNAESKEQKREMERLIADIKSDFRSEISLNDPKVKKLRKLSGDLYQLTNQGQLFEMSKKEKADWNKKVTQLTEETKKLEAEIEEIKANKIFENAFEWRFEFPEVLNDDGDFVGFDVVIGNPPYISAVNMKRDVSIKNYFSTRYKLVSGTYDIYALFVELVRDISNTHASFSYIIPNKFLVAKYSENLLNYLIKNQSLQYSINLSKHNIFDEASVYPIIIFGHLKQSKPFKKFIVENKESFIQFGELKEEKVLKKYPTIKDAGFKIQGGLAGFQADSVKKYIQESNIENSIPFTVSGCVDRYFVSNENVRYMGVKYKQAYITLDCNLSNDKLDFWRNPKIVIAGMTKEIESVYSDRPLALGVGIYGIHGLSEDDGYIFSSILNSKFISYYFKEMFKDKALAGGYLAINKNTIEDIPYLKPDSNISFKLLEKSKTIHELKKQNPSADTTDLENQIDQLVYQLYGLTEEEIKIVEGV